MRDLQAWLMMSRYIAEILSDLNERLLDVTHFDLNRLCIFLVAIGAPLLK